MEWQVILALIFAVTIILFPAMFIWYLNFGGMYTALRERGGIIVPAIIRRVTRVMLVVLLPIAVYAVAIWFFYGQYGWQVAVAVAVVFPIVLFVPTLIWAAVVSGLYRVVIDRLRRRVAMPRRNISAEPVVEVATKGE